METLGIVVAYSIFGLFFATFIVALCKERFLDWYHKTFNKQQIEKMVQDAASIDFRELSNEHRINNDKFMAIGSTLRTTVKLRRRNSTIYNIFLGGD